MKNTSSRRNLEIIVSFKAVPDAPHSLFKIECIAMLHGDKSRQIFSTDKHSRDTISIEYNEYLSKMNDVRTAFGKEKTYVTMEQRIEELGWESILEQDIGFNLYKDLIKSQSFSKCFKSIMKMYKKGTVEYVHFVFEGSCEFICCIPVELLFRGDEFVFLEEEDLFLSKRISDIPESQDDKTLLGTEFINPLTPDDLNNDLPIIFHIVLSLAIDKKNTDESMILEKKNSFIEEARRLENEIIKYKKSFSYNIVVQRVENEDATINGFRNYINKLNDKYYHVFHFIGEGDFKPDIGGVLNFENIDENTNSSEIVEMYSAELASLLSKKKVKFVYLSCCMGAAAEENKVNNNNFGLSKALIYLARIPSVLGFRWPLNSRVSSDFAYVFYDVFFNNNIIPKAAQAARCRVKNDSADGYNVSCQSREMSDNTWASPLLIYQQF